MKIGGYEVLEEIGRGGVGTVYKARDPRDGSPVAVKVLSRGRDATPQQRERFQREVHALASVRHPNVVRLLEAGEHRGSPYLAMEFHPEGSLQLSLNQAGPLSPERATQLGVRLASGLAAIHAAGVLHRDLKPDNVLFSTGMRALITDFGLTRDLGTDEARRLTQTGAYMGTPGFWAPEQAAGEPTGYYTDVYGLGATLYAAISGQPPIVEDSLIGYLVATRERRPASLSTLRPDVPAELEAVVMRCLERDPGLRWPDAATLKEALKAVARSLDPPLESNVDASRAPPTSRRRLHLGLALATILIALNVMVFLRKRPPTQVEPRDVTAQAPRPTSSASVVPSLPSPSGERGKQQDRVQATFDLDRGQESYRAGDMAATIDHCTRAIRADPSFALAYIWRGVALGQAGDLLRAMADLTKAIELGPEVALAYANRGIVKKNFGQMDGARQDLAKALELDPRLPLAYAGRGELRMLEGNFKDALADWNRVIEFEPGNAEVLCKRGAARHRLGDFSGALADYTATIALDPRSHVAFRHRAILRLRTQPEEALADFDKVIEIKPDNAAYRERGLALFELGRHRSAIESLDKAIELDGADDTALFNRGVARKRLGQHRRAVADLRRALAIDATPRQGLGFNLQEYLRKHGGGAR